MILLCTQEKKLLQAINYQLERRMKARPNASEVESNAPFCPIDEAPFPVSDGAAASVEDVPVEVGSVLVAEGKSREMLGVIRLQNCCASDSAVFTSSEQFPATQLSKNGGKSALLA